MEGGASSAVTTAEPEAEPAVADAAGQSDSVLFSVWIEDGTITVGEAVSTELVAEGLTDGLDDDSSMDKEAMAPGAGANDAGIPVGGCCFFLIMSL